MIKTSIYKNTTKTVYYMLSNTIVRSYLTCLLVFTLSCSKAQDLREPTTSKELREEVTVDTNIFTVIYSETKEQPLQLTYRSSNRPKNVDRGSMNFYTEDDEDVLDGKEEIINLLVGFLQVKIMQLIIENKEFESKDHFVNYCWRASENKIIDKVRELNREPSKKSLEQIPSWEEMLSADIYGEGSFLMKN